MVDLRRFWADRGPKGLERIQLVEPSIVGGGEEPGAVPHGGFGSPVSKEGPVPPEKVGLGGGSSEDLPGARSPPLQVLMCIHLTPLSKFT